MENFRVNNNSYQVELVSMTGPTVIFRINGREYAWELSRHDDETFKFKSSSGSYTAHVTESGDNISVNCNGELFVIENEGNRRSLIRRTGAESGQVQIRSPIPGLVTKIYLAEGDNVKAGGAILTLDAMKMQNEIQSPCDGVISKIYIKQGAQIDADTVMVLITRK